jgi:hypothetical protein
MTHEALAGQHISAGYGMGVGAEDLIPSMSSRAEPIFNGSLKLYSWSGVPTP